MARISPPLYPIEEKQGRPKYKAIAANWEQKYHDMVKKNFELQQELRRADKINMKLTLTLIGFFTAGIYVMSKL